MAAVVVGASVAGESHARAGVPCQDAHAWRVGDAVLRIAVADGLGSARLSHVGAARAVEAAVRSDGGAFAMATAARAALLDAADAEQCDLWDLACTLIAIAWSGDAIECAHIGDGAVVAEVDGAVEVLSGPARAEYVNVVDPLTSDDWERLVRVTELTKPVTALAAFTDGCERAALRADGTAHDGFFSPLFAYLRDLDHGDAARAELAALLDGAKIREHSDDDKTLVLARRV